MKISKREFLKIELLNIIKINLAVKFQDKKKYIKELIVF